VAIGSSPNKLLTISFLSESTMPSKWLQNIKYLLMVNGHGNVWVSPKSVTNDCFYKIFKKRLEDQFVQSWFEKARRSVSLSTLNTIKQEYSFGTYLSKIKSNNMRRIYVRLRLNYGILNHSRMNNPVNHLCKLCDWFY
jgi:creatinine amidohydrolase/Fe(II)-dependent formamide hydrolase-like protein